MSQRINEFGQPIGHDVHDWKGAMHPDHRSLSGRYCRVEALDIEIHARDLFAAYSGAGNEGLWTYMPVGPFGSIEYFREWMVTASASTDPLFYALVDQGNGKAVGIASYLRITPEHGVIEVGNIAFAPVMQKTPVATEAMFLMMQHAFDDLGFRRYEWKCDGLNEPSKRAAERLGFQYDGLFKQAVVYKGRNRDTAWFSILDADWPDIRNQFRRWLDPENFDDQGQQKQKLAAGR